VARRPYWPLLVLGVASLVLAGAWWMLGPGKEDRLAGDLDRTANATGAFTLYVDAATLRPVQTPTTGTVDISQRVRVVSSTPNRAVVAETDVQDIKGLGHQTFRQQYLLDRKSSRNVAGPPAWAYAPASAVDRSPDWSVNLPFHTGRGPYEIWKNELGAGFPVYGAGSTTVDGVTMQRLTGHVSNAPVQDYYVRQLGGLLPSSVTQDQLDPVLRARGYIRDALLKFVPPLVSPQDAAIMRTLVDKPLRLHYSLDSTETVLVEPKTGIVTDLARTDETLYAVPDTTPIRALAAIFAKPGYRSNAVLAAGARYTTALVAQPPRIPFYRLQYSQTPASVATVSTYAAGKSRSLAPSRRSVPLLLFLAGMAAAVIGGLRFVTADRRQRVPRHAAGRGRRVNDGG
jgi:hypothetical protein